MQKKVHFIGIWWIWMSALARYYNSKWYKVSWSDLNDSELLSELESEWIKISIWHCWENINWNEEIVFYTEAIPETNIEIKKAKKLWLKLMTYFQWLWELSKQYKTIAVAWTHWKSTTTAMVWILMKELNLSPTVIVWTKVPNFWNKNIIIWDWEYLIVEACEYKESFLNLELYWAIILNIEAEHLDYYENEKNYINAFKKFIWNISDEWFLVINWDDENCKKLIESIKNKAKGKKFNITKTTKKEVEEMPELNVPWDHIRFDALAAIKTLENIKLKLNSNLDPEWQNENFDFLTLTFNLQNFLKENFVWTWRRFEIIWEYNWNTIISDYWHHPTEIKATLKWAREKFKNKNIICIFEPHQYSRTIELFEDFCESFYDCNEVIIPSIYKVRDKEEDTRSMSAEKLAIWINKYSKNAKFLDWYKKTENYLREKDWWNIFLFMWAWGIDDLARRFK